MKIQRTNDPKKGLHGSLDIHQPIVHSIYLDWMITSQPSLVPRCLTNIIEA